MSTEVCGIHLRATSHELLKISIYDMILEITNEILQLHLPGANELNKQFKIYGLW